MSNEQMDPLHFCYWLKGYTEITDAKLPSEKQWRVINDHLNLVFNKVTPDYSMSGIVRLSPFVTGNIPLYC